MKKSILFLLVLFTVTGAYSQETTSSNLRKGVHLGAHITPGFGTIYTNFYNNISYGYGMTAGLDMNVYFSNKIGIHTGISYLNQPWRHSFVLPNQTKNIKATINSIGIPVKFLLTTGHKLIGFYLEAGFSVYFPFSYKKEPDLGILETNPVLFAPELTAGINIAASDKINFIVSGFIGSQYDVFKNSFDPADGALYGIKLGIMYHLKK